MKKYLLLHDIFLFFGNEFQLYRYFFFFSKKGFVTKPIFFKVSWSFFSFLCYEYSSRIFFWFLEQMLATTSFTKLSSILLKANRLPTSLITKNERSHQLVDKLLNLEEVFSKKFKRRRFVLYKKILLLFQFNKSWRKRGSNSASSIISTGSDVRVPVSFKL